MSQYLNQQQHWLSVVGLPTYAPEMNPVESLWANILGQELANRSVNDLGDMVEGVRSGFRRVHSEEWLLHSFLIHAVRAMNTMMSWRRRESPIFENP
jgi:putative transposase